MNDPQYWPSVVGPFVAVVGGVQVALAFVCFVRLMRHGLGLARVADGGGFPWRTWVSETFAGPHPAAVSREDAVREFDRRAFDFLPYAVLARMGVAAPLLGLLVTAVLGWRFYDAGFGRVTDLNQVFAKTLPLFLGIAAGAALALFNQLVMLGLGWQAAGLRRRATAWLDGVLARQAAEYGRRPDPTVGAVEKLDRAVGALAAGADRFGAVGEALVGVVLRLDGSVARFETNLDAMTGQQARLTTLLTTTGESVARLDAAATGIAATHDRLAAKTTDAVDRAVGAIERAAGSVDGAATRLTGAAGHLESAAGRADAATGELAAAAVRQAAGAERFVAVVAGIETAQAALTTAVEAMGGAALRFQMRTDGLADGLARTATTLAQFETTVGGFSGAVNERLLPAVRDLNVLTEEFQRFQKAAADVGHAAQVVNDVVGRYYRDAADVGPAIAEVTSQLRAAVAVREQLAAQIAGLAAYHEQLTHAAAGFGESAELAVRQIAGAAAAVGRVAETDLPTAAGQLVGTVGEVRQAGAAVGELRQALADVRRIVDALGGVPTLLEQVRRTADTAQTAAARAAQAARPAAKAKGRWWLLGR